MPASSSLAPLARILPIIASRLARTVAGVDAAQRVVGAEFEDHQVGLLGQRPVEPRQPAGGGVAGHPGIDDARANAVGASRASKLAGKLASSGRPNPAARLSPNTSICGGLAAAAEPPITSIAIRNNRPLRRGARRCGQLAIPAG